MDVKTLSRVWLIKNYKSQTIEYENNSYANKMYWKVG